MQEFYLGKKGYRRMSIETESSANRRLETLYNTNTIMGVI